MAIGWKTRRFTVKEYHRMGEARVLTGDDRVELLDGVIIEMTPIAPPHAGTVTRLHRLFWSRLGDRAIVAVQNPIELADQDSEPQPDVTLLRSRADFYTTAHPGVHDVLLVVEVMDTSVERDRRLKLPIYARAGIAEVWLVDLSARRVEVYRQPTPDGYRDAGTVGGGTPLTIQAFPDVALSVDDVLG